MRAIAAKNGLITAMAIIRDRVFIRTRMEPTYSGSQVRTSVVDFEQDLVSVSTSDSVFYPKDPASWLRIAIVADPIVKRIRGIAARRFILVEHRVPSVALS